MARRSPKWKRDRTAILAQLGAKCARCSSTKGPFHLDHRKAIRWKPERLSKEQRLKAYARAVRAGKLQVLCSTCHGTKTNAENGRTPWLSAFFDRLAETMPF